MSKPAVGPGESQRVEHTLSIARSRADLDGLRVLDLACCHGAFATAFALAGADVLGIEGRQENLDCVPPSTARYERVDVRDLAAQDYDTFDVTLCLGILYHLNEADALALLGAMRSVTGRFAIIDTHIGADRDTVTIAGCEFRGSRYRELTGRRRSSIGNAESWWFTLDSLRDALNRIGWTEAEIVPGHSWNGERADRRWLVVS